ncbi:MAG TPA: HlyD family secretion protein [Rhodopila sp.]|nr:HlyD family secretion protein [Rhodopila sp.]
MRYVRYLFRVAITLSMVAIAGVLLVALWRTYMLAPWTRDGRVMAQVVDVAPEVAGTVVKVAVSDNQVLHKGDLLFAIDPVRFQLAISEAQARVDAAQQELKLRTSDARRRQGLTGVVSAEEQEQFANTAAVARATLAGAQAALDVAKLNLTRSELNAPANGYVTHLRLRVGDYANVGQPRVAIVDSDSFWVTGYFEETKLRRIHVGDPARIRLMAYDAPVLGHVESIGRGISDPNDQISSRGLPTVSPIFTWVRLAQRVPVRIVIDQIPPGIELVAGLTASISLGTDATPQQTPQGRLLTWLEDNL